MREDERSEALSRLVLVGTVHGDPQGFDRLNAFFASFEPDFIFVELSPFARAFRKSHQTFFHKILRQNLRHAAKKLHVPFKEALRHPQVTAIRRQISLPFEYRTASSYVLTRKASLLLVDYSPFSRQWISSWPELVSADNLAVLLSASPSIPDIEQTYRSASFKIRQENHSGPQGLPQRHDENQELWEKRERHMAEQIEKTLLTFHPAKAVYAGGWWHLTTNNNLPTLRNLLGIDPTTQCFLLNERADVKK